MPKTLLVILMSLLFADALNLVVGPTPPAPVTTNAVAVATHAPTSTRQN
jgi:hydroxylamine reductase (hybrid-cluster protein)